MGFHRTYIYEQITHEKSEESMEVEAYERVRTKRETRELLTNAPLLEHHVRASLE
jgi:hypothetical protein